MYWVLSIGFMHPRSFLTAAVHTAETLKWDSFIKMGRWGYFVSEVFFFLQTFVILYFANYFITFYLLTIIIICFVFLVVAWTSGKCHYYFLTKGELSFSELILWCFSLYEELQKNLFIYLFIIYSISHIIYPDLIHFPITLKSSSTLAPPPQIKQNSRGKKKEENKMPKKERN